MAAEENPRNTDNVLHLTTGGDKVLAWDPQTVSTFEAGQIVAGLYRCNFCSKFFGGQSFRAHVENEADKWIRREVSEHG